MAIMVGEHLAAQSFIATVSEREQLRLYGEPPTNWQLWIANLSPGIDGGWVTNRFPMFDTEDLGHPHHNGFPRPNVQETSFSVGRLFIRGVSSPFPQMGRVRQFTAADELSLIIPIWPKRSDNIVWPPKISMSKDQWVIAASRLFELISRVHRRS